MSRQYWAETLAWVTADGSAIANTTTETIIFGNATILANYMADGRALDLIVRGKLSTATTAPTMRFRIRWGGVAGTVLADSGTITCAASVTNAMWEIHCQIQTRANGASGSLLTMGRATIFGAVAPTVGSTTGAPAIAAMGSAGITGPAAVTVDLTADTALAVTAQWGTADAANTLTGMMYLLKSLN